MAVNMKGKDLISIADLTLEEIYEIFDVSKSLKEKKYTGEPHRLLEGKTLGMILQNDQQEQEFLLKLVFINLAELVYTLVQMICSLEQVKVLKTLQKFLQDT
jgi:hypothetical protein